MNDQRHNEVDQKIRAALEAGDEHAPASEPPLFASIADTFRGRSRWLNIWGMLLTLVFMGLTIYAAVRFFGATETRSIVMWATAFVVFLIGVWVLKIWFWMQMNKYMVLRELKRLEAQVARLAERLDEQR